MYSFLFVGMMCIWVRVRFIWLVMFVVFGLLLVGMCKMMMLFDGYVGKEYWVDVYFRVDNNMV